MFTRLRRNDSLFSLSQLTEELVWWDEEWIHLKDAAENHHRMSAEHVECQTGTEACAVVHADDWTWVSGEHVIETCFVFEEVIHAREVAEGPFHMGDYPCLGKRRRRGSAEDLVD